MAPPKTSAGKTKPETAKPETATAAAKPAAAKVVAKAAVATAAKQAVKSPAGDKKPVASVVAPVKGDKNGKATPPVKIKAEPKTQAAKTAAATTVTALKPTNPARIETPAPAVGAKTLPNARTETGAKPMRATPAKAPEKTMIAKAPEAVAVPPAPAAVKTSADARPAAPPIAKPRPVASKLGFKLNEFIVYPAHGVGQITSVEIQEVAGFSLELYVVSFIKDKMILKVPTSKVATVGMRKLAETNIVEKALSTLSGRARIKRTMWSRRAQEYEAKINSGDLVTIAEVVRDLYRSDTQPEQSYSERQLYEAALDRMAREIAAVRRLIDAEAFKLIEVFLQKGPKRGVKTDAEGDSDSDVDDVEADVDAAA